MNDFFVTFPDSEEENSIPEVGQVETTPRTLTAPTGGKTFGVSFPEDQSVTPAEVQTEEIISTEPQDPFASYEGRSLTDEMILADPELMKVVDTSLQVRFGARSNLAGAVTGLAGGATGTFEGKSPEERLEVWNNWNRSFAGGQSVTTLNEVAFHVGASDEENAAIGASFELFDKKGNIFTGTETIGETFDGVFDYLKAAIYDPVTIASLGVGKALTFGGTKAAALALKATARAAFRQSLAAGATREVAAKAAKDATRMGFASLGAKTVAQYSAVDFAANVGSDIAYQNVLIGTKAQEEYSYAQTGIAALGTLAIPSIIAASKGIEALAVGARQASAKLPAGERNIFEAYVDVQRKFGNLGPDDITKAVLQRTNVGQVNASLQNTFQNFAANLQNFVPWSQAKVEAGKVLNANNIALTAGENQNLFWKSFLFGDTAGTQKGFVQELSDAGFVYVPRSKDDNITNFISDAMSWLDEATVLNMISNFESTVGKTFDGSFKTRYGASAVQDVDFVLVKDPTTNRMVRKYITPAEKLSSAFKNRQSLFGNGLNDSKQVQDILGKGGTVGQFAAAISKQADEEHPEIGKYVLSVWKRLVTSNLSTTALNVKGWASLSVMNTASDLVLGGLKLGEAAVYKASGQQGAYEAALNASKGSILGSIKRGYNLFTPTMTLEAADGYLMLKPELYESVLRTSSGGTDGANVLKSFNIDPTNKIANITENTVTGLQHITGVRLQDEVTKLLSFQSALEQGILREYGQTYNAFMSRPDAYTEMFTNRFKERVDAWALNRTLRETASKNWSQKKGRGVTLGIAKGIEAISRNPIGGYAVPFGSFMNTAFATLGDYSGFNAVKHLTARALNDSGISRTRFDFAEEEGMELVAKGIVGWSAVNLYLNDSIEKVEKGYAWNQEERDDGSIADITYEFPVSYLKIAAHMAAHYVKDKEIPESLAKQAFEVLGGQPFRQMDTAGQEALGVINSILTAEYDEAVASSISVLSGLGSRIISGALRPLDPVNQVAILMSDDYTQIDRKQANNKFLAESFRYVDQIFGGFDAPKAATSTRGFDLGRPDAGKGLGVRSVSAPNSIERVLSAVGKAPWQAVQWGGDDQVKNSMDGILGPILNAEAERMLRDNPDFFDKNLATKEKRVNEVLERAKNLATQVIDFGFSEEDTLIKLKRDLSNLPKKDVRRAMTYLDFTGDPMDIAKEGGGADKLEMLIYFSKNYNELLVE
jgi:hypothetical protein